MIDFRRVRAAELRPNRRNWRTHPAEQRDALRGVLAEIGFAGAVLARELADGSLELIDGHLRAETVPDMLVPVLVLDVTEAEADLLLATVDPLSAMAGIHAEKLDDLHAGLIVACDAVRQMLEDVAEGCEAFDAESCERHKPEKEIPELFQIVVECTSEVEQRELFDRLSTEGVKCKLLSL